MPTDELSGTLGLTIGNYEKRSASGTISGPLGERVRGRITLLANQREGIYRDIVSGRRYQNEDNLAGRSEEHTSELQSLMRISYAVFCLKKKTTTNHKTKRKT